MSNFYEILCKVLLQDKRLVAQDGKTLLRNYAFELGEKADKNLLKLLLENKITKKHFFQKVGDIMVFDKRKFCWIVNNRQFLPDSYTRFANKIGLIDDRAQFISQTENVQLAFPYKDCLLEGGQTKDDQKRNEIFWNELLSPDECDRLLEPKVLFFHERHEKQSDAKVGRRPPGSDDERSAPQRGAMSITPGFNRGHRETPSSPKPRRGVTEPCCNAPIGAKREGATANPPAEAGSYRHTALSGQNAQSYDCGSASNLLIKGNNLFALASLEKVYAGKVKLIYIDPPYNTGNDSFQYNDRFNHAAWLTFMKNRLAIAKRMLRNDGVIFVQCDDNEQAYLKVLMDEIFERENFVGTLIHQRAKGGGNARHIVKGHDYILVYALQLSDRHRFIREKVIQKKLIEIDGKQYIRDDDVVRKVFGKYDKSLGDRRCFYEELEQYKNEKQVADIKRKIEIGDYVLEPFAEGKTVICTYTPVEEAYSKIYSIVNAMSENGTNHIEGMGLTFSNPKPEEIIHFVIQSCSNPGDLVLDFFAGSGTTLAVAHKMGRRWIGVEQMDYIESVTVERMKKVVAGEQGGISKSVGWQGGGAFIYCELATLNATFIDRIGRAKTAADLAVLWKEMKEKHLYDYRMNVEAAEDFEKLSLSAKKQFLLDALDKDMLYVNLSDMDDENFGIKEKDKEFTKNFYGG